MKPHYSLTASVIAAIIVIIAGATGLIYPLAIIWFIWLIVDPS